MNRRHLIVAVAAGVFVVGLWIAAFTSSRWMPAPPPLPPRPTPTPSPTPPPPPVPAEVVGSAKLSLNSDPSKGTLEFTITQLKSIQPAAREYKEAQALLKRAESLLAKARAAEDKANAEATTLGPKPENSAWDGSVRCVEQYLKQTLNDYDSAEYLEWSPVFRMDRKDGPYWAVRLKLRAANAFGGKIVKNVIFYIRNNQVVDHTDL